MVPNRAYTTSADCALTQTWSPELENGVVIIFSLGVRNFQKLFETFTVTAATTTSTSATTSNGATSATTSNGATTTTTTTTTMNGGKRGQVIVAISKLSI